MKASRAKAPPLGSGPLAGELVEKHGDESAGKIRHEYRPGIEGLHTREILRLENVCKEYGDGEGAGVTAVCGIDFTVHKGELTGILGPSGSGKSTLLHLMGLLDHPTSGKIFLDGVETTKMSEDEQARVRGKKIGFVFQAFNLIPSLSALENVELPLIIYDMPASERRRKAETILEKLGLGHRMTHLPSQLSGGERQRVAIARALINDPEIILADEPTGNLDSKTGSDVLEVIEGLHHEGRTVIIVTHDESIVRITEKVLRIKDGKVVKTEVLA